MPYDHHRKAGNAADVWKHFILLAVADRLVGCSPSRPDFHYLETHAGSGLYPLDRNGAWRTGLGRLGRVPDALAQAPYFQVLGTPPDPQAPYPGSWLLLARRLRERGCTPRLALWESDPDIAQQASRTARDQLAADSARVHTGDGFSALAELADAQAPDLILVDPPFRPDAAADWERLLEAVDTLRRLDCVSLIWFPLTPETPAQGLSRIAGCDGWQLHWSDPARGGFWGCGLLALGHAALPQSFADLLATLARCLGARLGTHRSSTAVGPACPGPGQA
jgi:23S rRNA (adenine2030-N6)-methyltransferase